MSIIRLRKASAPHTVLLNSTIEMIKDAATLGVFVYLHTKPDNWRITRASVCKRFGLGRDKYQKVMRELRELGLLTMARPAGGYGGATGTEYTLHYEPIQEPENTASENQRPDNTAPEIQEPEKPAPEISGAGFSGAGFSGPLQTKEALRASQTKDSLQTKDIATGSDAPPQQPPTAATWDAYAEAYEARYGVPPIRNARVNGQLSQLVRRVGEQMAPLVAAYYLTCNRQWYVAKGHQVGPMLTDAEQLAAEVNGAAATTTTQARQADRHQAQGDVFRRLLARASG